MTILFLIYRQIRYLTRDDVDVAFSNARRVVEVERLVGVFNEAAVQDMVMNHDVLIRFFNHYYALVHFPITALFVIWVLVRHPDSYRRIRTWIVSVTAAALAIHVGFPLAPPRMLDREDFIDTLAQYGPHIYSANTEQSVANQFAAMPSLHFGWAVIVAAGFVGIHRNRISRIAYLHPIVTLLAIVATANHYWVDAAVALCIVAGAHHLLNHDTASIWSRSSARHQTRPPTPPCRVSIPTRPSPPPPPPASAPPVLSTRSGPGLDVPVPASPRLRRSRHGSHVSRSPAACNTVACLLAIAAVPALNSTWSGKERTIENDAS